MSSDATEYSRFALEAVDRELAFFRKRAGQVFFLSLLVEVLILGGRESIAVQPLRPWIKPITYSVLFMAVAAAGIFLGQEYRARIHILKNYRTELIKSLVKEEPYPRTGGIRLSEIEMLYVVLVFLSSAGVVLAWLNGLASAPTLSWIFWLLFGGFVLGGIFGFLWVAHKIISWLRPKAEEQDNDPKASQSSRPTGSVGTP